MIDFLNLKTEAFGLDISDLSLKIIKLKKKGSGSGLVSFGEKEIIPGIIKGGEIKDEKKLVAIIKDSLKSIKGENLKTRYLVVSLPEEKAFLEVIQLPRMSEEDLKSAVVFEAENYIPLPISQVYLDYAVIPPVQNHLEHLDILLAALPKTTIDPYLHCLEASNLKPKALEIESLAIARALIKNETSPQPVLLIDLGATRTSFIVFAGHSIRFTSSIPVSGQHFTQVIAKTLNIKETEAEKLKIKYGLKEKAKLEIVRVGEEELVKKGEKEGFFEPLIPPLVDLVQQIKRLLSYYQSHASHEHLGLRDNGVSKILLCGGGANLKGLPELLTLELKTQVELGNPWINILPEGKKETKDLPPEESLRYTAALGLALRGIKGDEN